MRYKHLFFDLDHTLWDFDANSRLTLEEIYHAESLEKRGVHDFELFHRNYLVHNDRLWDRYRNGYIKVDELRWRRMWLALVDFKIGDEKLARHLGSLFLDMLPSRTLLFPDTVEILQYLSNKNYQLHLITNGFEQVQHNKIRNSGIDGFFKVVITSEGSNSLKPKKEIFEYAFLKTSALPSESLMLGDSLEADILGGINAGIDQVHVNHINTAPGNIKPTYTVYSLMELKSIL